MGIKLDSFSNRVFIDEMVSAGHRIVCDRNQIIYNKGTQAKNLYLLEQGQIDFNDDGVARFSLSHCGDMFGWSSFNKNGVHITTASSKKISSVIQIPIKKVNDILGRHEETAIELHKLLDIHYSSREIIFEE